MTYELEIGLRLSALLTYIVMVVAVCWAAYGLYGAWLVIRHDNQTRGRR